MTIVSQPWKTRSSKARLLEPIGGETAVCRHPERAEALLAKRTGSIVTYVHHYKRLPPKKRAKPPLAVPAIVQRDAPRQQPVQTEEARKSRLIGKRHGDDTLAFHLLWVIYHAAMAIGSVCWSARQFQGSSV